MSIEEGNRARPKWLNNIAVSAPILILVLWLLAVVASGAGWNPFGKQWNFTNTGAFGDSFAPVSATMAAIAALAAIAAYRGQKTETERLRQREKEEDIRREASAQAQDKERQRGETERQQSRQEGTFFQLLATFQRVTADTDIKKTSGHVQTGRDAFHSMMMFLDHRRREGCGKHSAWDRTFTQYHNDLAHYFRLLYTIVRFVDESILTDKTHYIRILRSLLSEAELALLAYNCAYGPGSEKFKPLLEKFAILHSLSDPAKDDWRHEGVFASSAFGKVS